jgi:hypothetical protein
MPFRVAAGVLIMREQRALLREYRLDERLARLVVVRIRPVIEAAKR